MRDEKETTYRVALELAKIIKEEEHGRTKQDRKYWLALYRQCLRHVQDRVPPPPEQQQ